LNGLFFIRYSNIKNVGIYIPISFAVAPSLNSRTCGYLRVYSWDYNAVAMMSQAHSSCWRCPCQPCLWWRLSQFSISITRTGRVQYRAGFRGLRSTAWREWCACR